MISDKPHAISVRGLTKAFQRHRSTEGEHALNGVDLDVVQGEFLVLLGPSGCGKTTLLRTIAGLERPECGSILIEGQPVFDAERGVEVPAGDRPVNMIFQSYALWPHMTAYKHLVFPLRCRGVRRSEIARRVEEMLTTVGIGNLGDRYPSQMSGGQQQRLALARALVVGEGIILFDEPLSNVDAQVREKLRLELIRMQRSLRFTAIYVTHDQAEAMELADRIAVMSHGRILQLDEPRELYANPADVDVARFLGQRNEVSLTVETFEQQTGRVVGTGAVGRVEATWPARSEGPSPRAGEELIAFGRPSDFVVVPARIESESSRSSRPNGENSWRSKIEAMRFVGSHTECLVKIGDVQLRCWLGADETEALEEDDEVVLFIGAQKLRAMRES